MATCFDARLQSARPQNINYLRKQLKAISIITLAVSVFLHKLKLLNGSILTFRTFFIITIVNITARIKVVIK
jgi:hypothetical protein